MEVREDARARAIPGTSHLASFIDDTGVRRNFVDDHFYLLEWYFQGCQENIIPSGTFLLEME